jgi:hypothetical protein
MTTARDDVQATEEAEFQRASAEFMRRLEAVGAVETRKAALPAGHPDRPELAHRVEALAIELLTWSRYQSRLAEAQAHDLREPRAPKVVLDEWRAAVRRLEESSVQANTHADEVARLHAEYQRAVEQRD